jgi:hypothetical protein
MIAIARAAAAGGGDDDCMFPIRLADGDVSTRGVCRILIEMADALFSSSWRIREQYGCSGISLATTTAIPQGAGPLHP